MTLKKFKGIRAQSIFEYFITTMVVVGLLLFFTKTDSFKQIKGSLEKNFNRTAQEMTSQ